MCTLEKTFTLSSLSKSTAKNVPIINRIWATMNWLDIQYGIADYVSFI